MDQQPQDPAPGYAVTGRARGLRQVRRWSNWTAGALIAATVVTTGYFAHASAAPAAPAAVAAAGQAGTTASPNQPCVSVPVATSGGSGVTKQTVVRSCGTGTSTSAPVVITTGRTHEGGDS